MVRAGREYLNFSSNDYLGLSQHHALIDGARDAAARYGAGSTASRYMSGNNPLYEKIENLLAAGKGSEAALVFSSGYQANYSVLAALTADDVLEKPAVILADRLAHNSLLQNTARQIRFQHNDLDHLESLLKQHGNGVSFIVTESVFGMDGDRADMAALKKLAALYHAVLYVDEAHATGVYGPQGFGLTAHEDVGVAMGTFGKALGSFGAYVTCSALVREVLIQRCGGLIYTTALPPPVLGAMQAALELLPQLDDARTHLARQAARLREALKQQGWNIGGSDTHIIPVILDDEGAALHMAARLFEKDIFALAIRPPTVPRGSSRLRFSLSAAHGADDIAALISAMAELRP